MDELFRMMTVRAPQVTTDPNVVTVSPTRFQTPPPSLDQQYDEFLKANEYHDISDLDFSRSGTLSLFPDLRGLVGEISTPTSVSLDPKAFKATLKTIIGQ